MPPKASSKDVGLSDELLVKSADLLFMRDNFIDGLSHLESGVHELKRAYITQFNTLLPEGHPGRLQLPYDPPAMPMGLSLVGLQPAPLLQAAVPVETAENGKNGKKRARKPHDEKLPKRALTSYFLFMGQSKPAIKIEHPDWDAKEIALESQRRWDTISDKERAEYEYMYQVDLARYYKQKEYYSRGEPFPEISLDEAKALYAEHLQRGEPFKGRKAAKGSKPSRNAIPSANAVRTEDLLQLVGEVEDDDDDDDDDDSESEESEELHPPPPKLAKTKMPLAPKPVKGRV